MHKHWLYIKMDNMRTLLKWIRTSRFQWRWVAALTVQDDMGQTEAGKKTFKIRSRFEVSCYLIYAAFRYFFCNRFWMTAEHMQLQGQEYCCYTTQSVLRRCWLTIISPAWHGSTHKKKRTFGLIFVQREEPDMHCPSLFMSMIHTSQHELRHLMALYLNDLTLKSLSDRFQWKS